MIKLSSKDWYSAWKDIQILYGSSPYETIDSKFGNRAFSFDNEIEIESNDLNGLNYSLVGYAGRKQNSIWYHYFDNEDFDYIVEKLRERVIKKQVSFTILNYLFLQKNNQHNLDGCLSNIYVIAKKIGKDSYDIEYEFHIRTGEVTKRLCADFVFFSLIINRFNEIFENININVKIVVKAKSLYAQPPFFLIAKELITMNLNKNHWFTKKLEQDEKTLFNENYKFKMGKRIRKYILKIKEQNND